MIQCTKCSRHFRTLRKAKRHWRAEHYDPEYETPEEYLPSDGSEQRDFAGDEPDESEHSPEYLETRERTETRKTYLKDYAEEGHD